MQSAMLTRDIGIYVSQDRSFLFIQLRTYLGSVHVCVCSGCSNPNHRYAYIVRSGICVSPVPTGWVPV